jgi:hypothetical protein
MMRAIGESSTFIPSWSEVHINTLDFHTNTSDFHISPSDLYRYRPILRPISFIVRYYHSHQYIHSFLYHLVYQVISTRSLLRATIYLISLPLYQVMSTGSLPHTIV